MEPLRRHALHDAIDEHMRAIDGHRYWGWPMWPDAPGRGPRPTSQAADAPDRVGMTEIRHVEGLYAYWDELPALVRRLGAQEALPFPSGGRTPGTIARFFAGLPRARSAGRGS